MATSSATDVDLWETLAAEAAAESPLWEASLRPLEEQDRSAVFSTLCEPVFALGVETIYEGYLLHYGRARLFCPADADTALLLGDYLYAHGLVRIAATGSVEAVHDLAELISLCAQARADGRGGEAEAWAATAALLGQHALGDARSELRLRGNARPTRRARAGRGRPRGTSSAHVSRTTSGWGKVASTMLAFIWLVADAAEEGRKVVLSMLVVGPHLRRRDRTRRADAPPLGEAQGAQAQPHAVESAAMEKRIAALLQLCFLHASRDPEAGNLRFPVIPPL